MFDLFRCVCEWLRALNATETTMTATDLAFYGSILVPLFGMLAISVGKLICDVRRLRREG